MKHINGIKIQSLKPKYYFVAVYSSDGDIIQRWLTIIVNLLQKGN